MTDDQNCDSEGFGGNRLRVVASLVKNIRFSSIWTVFGHE